MQPAPSAPGLVLRHSGFTGLVRADLESRIRKDKLDTWFRHVALEALTDDEAVFAVPSGFVRDFLTRNHLAELRRAVHNVGGLSRSVRLVVAAVRPPDAGALKAGIDATLQRVEDDAPPLTSYEAERRRNGSTASKNGNGAPAKNGSNSRAAHAAIEFAGVTDSATSRGLNSSYSFETFVVGPCNRLGHAHVQQHQYHHADVQFHGHRDAELQPNADHHSFV